MSIKSTSGVFNSCCTTEAIQATLLALQCFIKCKRNNSDTDGEFVFRPLWYLFVLVFEIEANWYTTYLNATPCLKPDETGFMFGCCSVRFCSIDKILGWVRLSSIIEPNRSQSNDCSLVGFRLINVWLATAGINFKFTSVPVISFSWRCLNCNTLQNSERVRMELI